jgi:hypothetical protein
MFPIIPLCTHYVNNFFKLFIVIIPYFSSNMLYFPSFFHIFRILFLAIPVGIWYNEAGDRSAGGASLPAPAVLPARDSIRGEKRAVPIPKGNGAYVPSDT